MMCLRVTGGRRARKIGLLQSTDEQTDHSGDAGSAEPCGGYC